MSGLHLSRILVLVPVFNAANQIEHVITDISTKLTGVVGGLLVIDNQSSDATLDRAKSAIENSEVPLRYLIQNLENRGLGGSLKIGFQFAAQNTFSHVLVVHGDNQSDPDDFLKVLTDNEMLQIAKVYGSRFMKSSNLVGYSQIRRVGNVLLNLICSRMIGRRIYDLGSGLNLYRREYFDQEYIYDCRDDLTFNNELLLSEPKPIMTEAFVPISWKEVDQQSNARVLRQGIRTISLAIRYGLFRKTRSTSPGARELYSASSYKVIYAACTSPLDDESGWK